MPETLPLAEIIRRAVKRGLARTHTQVPGRIVEYDHSAQRATVQLIVSHAFEREDERREYYKPAPLVNVPVTFPAIFTWPLAVGDPGWVQFAERSIDEYLATGRANTEPADARRFDLSDATFSPCYFRGEADTQAGAAIISSDDLRVRSSSTALTRPVAISPEVAQFLIAFITTEVIPHIHSDPLTGTTGPSPGPFTPPGLTDFDADNVEAE